MARPNDKNVGAIGSGRNNNVKRYGFGSNSNLYGDRPQRLRDASIQPGADWKLIEEIEFSRLSNLHFEVDEPEDL